MNFMKQFEKYNELMQAIMIVHLGALVIHEIERLQKTDPIALDYIFSGRIVVP